MNKPNLKNIDLDQIDQSPEFHKAIDRDFGAATEGRDGLSRRRWLQIMGASLALGGMSGCRYEEEKIAPFAFRPQNRVPGVAEKFATMMDFGGVAQPILATCYDGRPIKLDGNPSHPLCGGSSTTYTQAAILEMYDPERLRNPLKSGDDATWQDINDAAKGILSGDLSSVCFLSEQVGSPSLERIRKELTGKGATWATFASIGDDNTRAGSKLAFGKAYRTQYAFDQAKVVVCIDSDALQLDPNGLGNCHAFGKMRNPDEGEGHMSRLYVVESQYSTTGGSADHRISVRSSDIAGFVGALAAAIDSASDKVDESLSYRDKILACMADDLVKNKGEGMIVCGERQPAEVHAAVHALNSKLENLGKTITFTEIPDADANSHLDNIKAVAEGSFKTIVIVGGNPVYTAPAELDIAKVISDAENSIYLGMSNNETARACKWVASVAHPLESWGDGYAFDGSICISQPLINPLFGGTSVIETLSIWMGSDKTDGWQSFNKPSGCQTRNGHSRCMMVSLGWTMTTVTMTLQSSCTSGAPNLPMSFRLRLLAMSKFRN